MKRVTVILMLGIFLILSAGSVYAYEAIQGPTELILYDQANAYNGYTVFTSISGFGPPYTTYMIDMQGNIVNTWESDLTLMYGYLLENGNLLRSVSPPEANAPLLTFGGSAGRLEEVDWDGNVVWSVDYFSPTYRQHHDHQRIWNAKLEAYTNLMVAWETRTKEEAEAKGGDPQWESYEDGWSPDTIVEVDMDGNVIWIWRFFDHIVSNYDPTTENYGDPTAPENWGKLDQAVRRNMGEPGFEGDWNHINSMDYNAELDQICLNSREHGEFYVIDHSLTTEQAATDMGDFVYRWGNPSNYGQGAAPEFNNAGNEQIFGAHDIQWIKPGLPGAGNFLVFENGSFRPAFIAKSFIFEIDPYDDEGNYVQQHDAGYGVIAAPGFFNVLQGVSNQVVWAYLPNHSDMYSGYISGCQRLPNNNTLMCAGEEGNFVEVTTAGEPVWNYVSPISNLGISKVYTGAMNNAVFRCYRYGPGFPGLLGKDLTPKGKITEATFGGAMEKFQTSKSQ